MNVLDGPRVILKVLANIRVVQLDGNLLRSELSGGPDSGKHEKLRGGDGPRGDDDLLRGGHAEWFGCVDRITRLVLRCKRTSTNKTYKCCCTRTSLLRF